MDSEQAVGASQEQELFEDQPSVEQAPGQSAARHRSGGNIGAVERIISGVGGGALIAYGLSRRSLTGTALAAVGGVMAYRAASGRSKVYEALGVTDDDATMGSHPLSRHIRVQRAVTIQRPVDEVFSFWRNFENLPRFMYHLESVKDLGDGRSHWVAIGPADSRVEWDAQIIDEKQNQFIIWHSLEDAGVDNAGTVRFHELPMDRGTEVHVTLDYRPPGGVVGAAIAWMFGREPHIQVREDLRRFKQIMETGEIPTIEGQPQGTCGGQEPE